MLSSTCEVIGEIVETRRIREDELTVEWRIRDPLSLPRRDSYIDTFNSRKFRFNGERWFLTLNLYDSDKTQNPPTERLNVRLYRNDSDEDPTETINVNIGIKASQGVAMQTELECCSASISRPTEVFSCSTEDFRWKSESSRHNNPLVPYILTIICVMKNIEDLSAGGESSQGDIRNLGTEVKLSSVKRGGEKANEDFGELLASGMNSDITVHVGGVEFGVHKAILSVRSPVLSAMFQHNTSERMSNKLIVEDCKSDIFKDFLHYIYAGSVQHLTEQNVFALYCVADKYLTDDLKLQCLEHIEGALSIQRFCDTVKFALVHEENDLLKAAVKFASKNILLIIRTAEWENFIREFPAEANEILIQSLGPLSQNQNAKKDKSYLALIYKSNDDDDEYEDTEEEIDEDDY